MDDLTVTTGDVPRPAGSARALPADSPVSDVAEPASRPRTQRAPDRTESGTRSRRTVPPTSGQRLFRWTTPDPLRQPQPTYSGMPPYRTRKTRERPRKPGTSDFAHTPTLLPAKDPLDGHRPGLPLADAHGCGRGRCAALTVPRRVAPTPAALLRWDQRSKRSSWIHKWCAELRRGRSATSLVVPVGAVPDRAGGRA